MGPLQNQAVCAECFFVEEDGFFQMHRVKQFLVVVLEETPHVDSQLLQKPHRLLAVIARRLDGLGTTVSEQQSFSCLEFIARGVPAEIIVIVED